MKRETLTSLTIAVASGNSVVLATRLDTGEQRLINTNNATAGEIDQSARAAAQRDQSSTVIIDGVAWFFNVFNSPPTLYIVGAVHIAQPLSQIAALSGFTVTVIDPRTAFATNERFPNLHLITAWPDEALAELPLDRRTAVVTLTHDPKLDDPALVAALRSNAFYVGALGSKKTHAARLARLKAAGFDDAAVARIHGPVGLDIGAISPAEIAVSIMAQIVERLRK
ncbi:MAG: XdhC family protein [Alphaproteobacteria bacterium]|nr:XdhC family protein [Alphaproteobacteria bacterium]